MNNIEIISYLAASIFAVVMVFVITTVLIGDYRKKEQTKMKYAIPPNERLQQFIDGMKAADRACVEFKSGGSGLKDLIYLLDINFSDIEECLYQKALADSDIPMDYPEREGL